jgi:hypothetical protein
MTLAVLNADIKTSNLRLGGANAILTIGASFNHANAAHASANAGMAIGNAAFASANAGQATANAAFNRANNSLLSSSYTAADVLSKLLTVDGAGTNLDADLLDGQQGAYYGIAADVTAAFLRANNSLLSSSYTAADVLSKLLTVDGAGTNLDADLLDGQQGAYYGIATDVTAANRVANAAFLHANSGYAFANSIAITANLAFVHANAAHASANAGMAIANAAFGRANTALPNTSGVSFAGNLNFPTGNVGIGTASPAYRLEVIGSFAAQTKSFVINHPTKSDMKLRYGSLEGPENGVYVRGRVHGPYIYLPDYWLGLVDEHSITVSLTPIAKTAMPSVLSWNNEKVVLHSDSPIDCFYYIIAERKDVEKLVVEF